MALVIQLLVLHFSVIISPGEDVKTGTITFPNTQKIPDNQQLDELSTSAVVDALIAETP